MRLPILCDEFLGVARLYFKGSPDPTIGQRWVWSGPRALPYPGPNGYHPGHTNYSE